MTGVQTCALPISFITTLAEPIIAPIFGVLGSLALIMGILVILAIIAIVIGLWQGWIVL